MRNASDGDALGTAGSARSDGGAARMAAPPVGGEQLGRVIVSQSVLEAVVEMTTLTVPGVVRTVPQGRRTVHVTVDGNAVSADVGIVVAAHQPVGQVSDAVRRRVAAAIKRLLGMDAREVNVFVRDVEGVETAPGRRGGLERDSEG